MADDSDNPLAQLLQERYGEGYRSPVAEGDSADEYSTPQIVKGMRREGLPTEALRAVDNAIPGNTELSRPQFPLDPRSMSALNMVKGYLGSTGNWLSQRQHDPSGADMMMPPFLPGAGTGRALESEAMTPLDSLRAWYMTARDRSYPGRESILGEMAERYGLKPTDYDTVDMPNLHADPLNSKISSEEVPYWAKQQPANDHGLSPSDPAKVTPWQEPSLPPRRYGKEPELVGNDVASVLRSAEPILKNARDRYGLTLMRPGLPTNPEELRGALLNIHRGMAPLGDIFPQGRTYPPYGVYLSKPGSGLRWFEDGYSGMSGLSVPTDVDPGALTKFILDREFPSGAPPFQPYHRPLSKSDLGVIEGGKNDPTLFADNSKNVPGTVVNAMNQRAGSDMDLLRRSQLNGAREGLYEPAPMKEEGWINTPLGLSLENGGAKYWADMALRQSKGDFGAALQWARQHAPEAANVLNYWRDHAGLSFRPYADPSRSQAFWQGQSDFRHAERPSKLNSKTASPVSSILSQYDRKDKDQP